MATKNPTKDTVLTLHPTTPLTCSPTTTIYEASQRMMRHKENCMLVIKEGEGEGEGEELLGLFTTKDLAFRVVGDKLNMFETTVDKIMTINPMCAKETTLANDALQLMIIKKFRHLPIINLENQITGVLDITKCYQLAIKRLEKLYENFKGFYDTLEIINKANNNKNLHIISYFENIEKLINGPRLNELLNNELTIPIYCNKLTNIFEVSKMMKLHKTTAILVNDEMDNTVGIFTSKDIVSRVISKGLEPEVVKVGDFMTLKLATASNVMSINEALKQMFDGKYLNLPVINELNGEIIGIVDIIRLVNYTLNQIQTMEALNEDGEEEDFERFWGEEEGEGEGEGEGECDGEDDAEVGGGRYENGEDEEDEEYVGDVSIDELSQFNMSTQTIVPKGSKKGLNYEGLCSFKFRICKGKYHRLSYKPNEGVGKLKEILKKDLNKEERDYLEGDFQISYIDEDNDMIVINEDEDLRACVLLKKQLGFEKIDIILMNKSEKMSKRGKMSKGESNLLLPLSLFTLSATIICVFVISRRK